MRTDCSVRAVAVHKQSAYIVKMESIKRSTMYLIKALVQILPLVLRVGISDIIFNIESIIYNGNAVVIPLSGFSLS